MKITFEQKDEKEVLIKSNGKTIGHIFTPGGTGHDKTNCIQVCGFDRAFSLWGCGIFVDDKEKHKQDIQLLFNKNSIEGGTTNAFRSKCTKCYNDFEPVEAGAIKQVTEHDCLTVGKRCTCDELEIAKEKDLNIEKEVKKCKK